MLTETQIHSEWWGNRKIPHHCGACSGLLYANVHDKFRDQILGWSLQEATLSKILKRVLEGLPRRLWSRLWSECVQAHFRATSKGLTWYVLQEGIHTGGIERAPYVSTDASASQSSQPQPSSPFLPPSLLHKQNRKKPSLQLVSPFGILKQNECTGQISISSSDNFFMLITFELHIKLFIATPALKLSSLGCQGRR